MNPRIEAISGRWWKKHSFPITESGLTIGRDPANKVVLDDDVASRRQCTLRPENGWCVLVDLQSHNGTFVNRFSLP